MKVFKYIDSIHQWGEGHEHERLRKIRMHKNSHENKTGNKNI